MHILLVEDDRTSRTLLNVVLQAEGHTVALAVDGEQAWDLLGKNAGRIDVCLLDLNLPGMSGFNLLRRIRAGEPHRRLPVILCTALKDRESVRQAAGLGVSHFIGKPFGRLVVRERLNQVAALLRKESPKEDSVGTCERLGISPQAYEEMAKSVISPEVYAQTVKSVLSEAGQALDLARNPADAAASKAALDRIPSLVRSCLNLEQSALAAKLLALKKLLEEPGAEAEAGATSCLDEAAALIKQIAESLTPAPASPAPAPESGD